MPPVTVPAFREEFNMKNGHTTAISRQTLIKTSVEVIAKPMERGLPARIFQEFAGKLPALLWGFAITSFPV